SAVARIAASSVHSRQPRHLFFVFLLSLLRPAPIARLFPYTTLFRSGGARFCFPPRPGLWRPEGSAGTHPTREADCAAVPLPVRRSEEHTSELQSRVDLVCRLLLDKNKKKHEHIGRRKGPVNQRPNSR